MFHPGGLPHSMLYRTTTPSAADLRVTTSAPMQRLAKTNSESASGLTRDPRGALTAIVPAHALHYFRNEVTIMRRVLWVLAVLSAGALGGCGAQSLLLGTQGEYLFAGHDVLGRPGEEVQLQARLQGGDFLRGQPGLVVRFSRDGQPYKAAETDNDGVAQVAFTPTEPGNYVFAADLSPKGFSSAPPPPTDLLVACRKADTPLMVVDLDKTLVESGFEQVLIGDPRPMPGSAQVMAALAQEFSVVYLTHRPDYFGPKSKAWLKAHLFPRGPLLLSDIGGFLRGSAAFKTAALEELRKRFSRIEIGVGDKVSDALAYHANGIKGFLIVQTSASATAAALRAEAKALDELPDAVQVVTGWGEIEKAVFQKATFPKQRVQQELVRRAQELEAKANAAKPSK
jgi:hypothetical protein